MPVWFQDQAALPDGLRQEMADDLAESAGVDSPEVLLIGSMSVQWPNSALGCPEPGEMSLQVITDGYLAYFEVAQSTVRVHSDLAGNYRVCGLPGEPEIIPQT